MARGLKFQIKKVEGLYYLCSENKGTDQLAVTAKLICFFVFAHAKSLFSHDKAHLITDCSNAVLLLQFSMMFVIGVSFGAVSTFI